MVFSAGANQQALDALSETDPNPNGVFTREFLPWLNKPGTTIREAVQQVRSSVRARAKRVHHEQFPAIYDQAEGDFYFTEGSGASEGTQLASLEAVANPAPAPTGGGVSLDDLKKQKEARAQWAQWQQAMKADYDKVEALGGEADIQVIAWERFLSNYAQDNPYSAEDKQLRAQAQSKKQAAQAQQQQATAQLEQQKQEAERLKQQAAQTVSRPGQTFRDCPDCAEMIVIPAGNFKMGSNKYVEEKPIHSVTIGKSFALGKTEVTQGQWKAIMGNNPSNFRACGENCPVEQVSWDEAQEYIRKLNQKTGKSYCLPSEAEWEYACKAGGSNTYCGGDNPDNVAWYGAYADPVGNRAKTTNRVATKQANSFGLYDMSGNVWEWVEDCKHDNYQGAPNDGSVWGCSEAKLPRVLRGGSWYNGPVSLRASSRSVSFTPDTRFNSIGFRVAR